MMMVVMMIIMMMMMMIMMMMIMIMTMMVVMTMNLDMGRQLTVQVLFVLEIGRPQKRRHSTQKSARCRPKHLVLHRS